MTRRPPRKATAKYPSFCWDCGRKLRTKRGGGFSFAIVVEDGKEHRVHHTCAPIGPAFVSKP